MLCFAYFQAKENIILYGTGLYIIIMAVQYLGLLLLVLSAWLTQYPTSGKLQPTQDCTTAWECCIYEFLSDEFNPCCNDHGCCPLCDKYWPEGCCFNNETYKFGSIVIEHPENCIKFLCTAEPLLQIPFIKATVHPVFYNSGTANTYCSGNLNLNCVDKFGILRPEGSEWFVSATCELCQCIKGKIECRPVKRPCPPPPNPVCVPKPGGCCPQWDCGSLPKNGAGCIANDGTYFSYGQAWWDSQNPCVYNKCTENGILQFKKDCSKLLPPSNPSCRLIKPENECCEKWQCDLQCPDPSSYGRVCFHYFDQCKSDLDCKTGESCCLVAGCGQECIRLCKDSLGNFHTIGEVWLEPYTQENFTCTEEGSKPVNKNGVQTPPPIPKEPEIYPHRPTLADCLSTGLNLTKLAQDLQILSNLTDVFPLKDPNQYLSEYLEIFRQDDGLLTPDETRRVQTLAERFNWSSVFSLLNVDTKEQQLAALSAGDASLQIKNVVSEAIAQRNDTLLSDSPSVKHQVAFRRTDPISTQMAQLGVVIEEATLKLVLRFVST
ncbi:hypothetical protein SK128_015651 [Halocaridina rubra]|uniref:VWFC domain-containing protein n=1 Tax=Halocaridina rubra TaxID=373956 RepID=A0AAN8XKM2_HALRR